MPPTVLYCYRCGQVIRPATLAEIAAPTVGPPWVYDAGTQTWVPIFWHSTCP